MRLVHKLRAPVMAQVGRAPFHLRALVAPYTTRVLNSRRAFASSSIFSRLLNSLCRSPLIFRFVLAPSHITLPHVLVRYSRLTSTSTSQQLGTTRRARSDSFIFVTVACSPPSYKTTRARAVALYECATRSVADAIARLETLVGS